MQLQAACFALFDELPDVVFFCKDAQGRYTHANRTLLLRLGLPAMANLRGKTAAQVFPAQLGGNYLEQDLRVVASRRSVVNELEHHLFPNHSAGWCLTVKHPLLQGNNVSGIVGISRDLKNPSPQNPVYRRLAQTLAYARAHCTDPLTVGALAVHAGLSVAQLERHLMALLQLTPGRWLLSLRLDAAIRMLAGTGSIAQIAADSGFADHSAFARAFRRHVGVSPTQYRQLGPAGGRLGLNPEVG
ncbi:MAG: AraC family transcriptional regulator [Rhodoferax sp.]|nr:AraC family transcriptional regulator [Rhodoferax sp.]